MSHLLTVKKFNDQFEIYQGFRSEWLDEADALRVEQFMQQNGQVRGLYKYTLTTEDGNSKVHYSLCADLTEYARHQSRKTATLIVKTIGHA